MSTEQNKAVVRRFISEVLAGGNLAVLDEVLGSTYKNRAFGDADLAGFKGALAGLAAALPEREFKIEDLIAEGDAVIARFTSKMTEPSGKTISFRGLTYYKLADGRIVEDDPFTTPDLMATLGPLMPAPTAS